MNSSLPARHHALPAEGTHLTAGPHTERHRPEAAPHIVYVRLDQRTTANRQSSIALLRSILESFTPAVDPDQNHGYFLNFFGSAYLDSDFPGTLRRLQLEILQRTAIAVSIGAARTKAAAAVASRLNHPGRIVIVPAGTEAKLFASLPVEALHNIGPINAFELRRRGISTVAELRRVPLPALQSVYGEATARQIWHLSRAMDTPSAASPRWSVATALDFFASLLQDKRPCIASTL